MTDLLLCNYLRGDLNRVPTDEADPWTGWAESIEASAGDMRSILLFAKVVACIGYVPVSPGVADSFAVVDRSLAAGHGKALARMVREQTLEWMEATKTVRAAATCSPHDRVAQVFLRAIGYHRECVLEAAGPNGADLMQFKLIRREPHGQDS